MAAVPDAIAAVFTEDARLRAIVVPTLLVAAVTLPPDGAQGVLMGALRGTGDVWMPTVLHLCSFTLVMIPAAVLFAILLDWGTPGLMAGALCGTMVATLLLGGRFRLVSGRTINRL
jgi:MATE family multidrug resistance protein